MLVLPSLHFLNIVLSHLGFMWFFNNLLILEEMVTGILSGPILIHRAGWRICHLGNALPAPWLGDTFRLLRCLAPFDDF